MSIALLSVSVIVFLLATFFLTAFSTAIRRIQKRDGKKTLKSLSKCSLYRFLKAHFFPHHDYDGVNFSLTCALAMTRFCYVLSAMFLTLAFNSLADSSLSLAVQIFIVIAFLLLFFIVGDFLPQIVGMRYPDLIVRRGIFAASLFMFMMAPITYPFFRLTRSLSRTLYFHPIREEGSQTQQDLLEMIQEAGINTQLDAHDKELIESVVLFRDRIAREVMVPRVNIFGLPAQIKIRDAAKLLGEEGYSRIPIYHQSMDNIIGVLMYKDVLAKYMEYEEKKDSKILDAPVETILKHVLYTPETKKISHLLQEFRKKQVHLAIVVDEYGGTEGIVTIEDILEEIVGEIADEYDEEETLFIPLSEGEWIVDARMGILDVEEELNISIPQEGDYDTIGGYIFHYAGTIPSKGYIIRTENFELEILRSTDRCVEKVRIKPIHHPNHSHDEKQEEHQE